MKSRGPALEELWKEFSEYDPDAFVTRTTEGIRAAIAAKGYKGVVFGASGGIDSLVSAALCVQAKKDKKESMTRHGTNMLRYRGLIKPR